MLSDFRKSINAILFERVQSPFLGTLTVSWLIWNWKIVYLTFFVSESKINITKLEYITTKLADVHFQVTFPLISTLIFITIIPFLSNGAYWLTLLFRKWRIEKKKEVENTQQLSISQSISLRKELRDKEIEFERILEKKSNEENLLKSQINELESLVKKQDSQENVKPKVEGTKYKSNSYSPSEYHKLKQNQYVFNSFGEIAKSIQKKYQFPENTPEDLKEYYIVNDIVEEDYSGFNDGLDKGFYKLTFKGVNLYRDYFNENFEQNLKD